MKKISWLFAIVFFILTGTVSAQSENNVPKQGPPPQISAEKRTEQMAKELNLTDEQKTKVLDLFKKEETERKNFKPQSRPDPEEMKAKFEEERKKQDAELEEIIGKEKFAQYEALREKEMKEHAPDRN
jgi:periplasmic protein CpxP/Spy